ncbi:hypothetical protein GCM10027456_53660 [Kineosporia babensis]
MPASRAPGHGRLLAGFEILGELGRGAQSTVFKVRRAEDPEHEYALKILDKPLADSHEAEVAFRREAALLAGVNHPGLLKVYEVGALERRPYLVMDLVSGRALSAVLEGGALSAGKVVALTLDIVEPLSAVHDRGLVHRDLKPANVIMMAEGEARLIDFGLTARDQDDEGELAAVGTLAYAAPEQGGTLKRPVDSRSDLYSLGVIMFQALSGVLPFKSADLGELLRMHAVTPAPDLAKLVPGIPPALAEIVATLLAKDPDDRYQSGRDLAADLRALTGAPRRAEALASNGETPLFGRNAELSILSGRWNEVRNGRSGVALVHGGGGTGKTRLVTELLNQVRGSGSLVLQANCVPDSPVPFAPIRDAVLNYLQEIARMPVGERWRRRARIRAASAGWSPSMLGRIAPGLEAILNGSDTLKGKDNLTQRSGLGGRGRDGRAPADAEEPEAVNESQFAVAIAGFLAALARESGDLLLFLDDVQWLDTGSGLVVSHLAEVSSGSRVLVLAASRDEVEYTEGLGAFYRSAAMALDVEVPVHELDEETIGQQIRSLIPGLEAGSRLVEILSRRSNGNPFVAGEYLSAVIDAGLLEPSWGSWKLDEDGLDRLELPQDAVGLVLTRLQNLAPGTYELLVTAAVVGNEFQGQTLATVMGLTDDEVLPALSEAVGQRLIDTRDAGTYVFLHDRVRQALQAQLGEDELASMHLRIAQALEQASPGNARPENAYAMAYHYMQCSPDSDELLEQIFQASWRAGRLALANHAPNEAINFLEFAAGLQATPPGTFLIELAHALKQNGRLEAARNRTQQALAQEPDPVRRAGMFALLADLYKDDWDNAASLEAVQLGLGELGIRLPGSHLVLAVTSWLRFSRDRIFRSVASDEAARQRMLITIQLHATASFVALFARDHTLALAHALRARTWAVQLGPGAGNVMAQASYGMVAAFNGRRGSAYRAFRRMDQDPVSELPTQRAANSYLRGLALYGGGLDDGVQWTKEIEADGPWMELGQELDALSVFSARAVIMGRTSEAQHWLDRGRNRQTGRNVDATPFIVAAPMTFSLLGRFPEAGTELRQIRQICERVPSLDMQRQLATLFQLAEQRDFGKLFDTVADEVAETNPHPEQVFRAHHPMFYLIAVGRLAQLRSAEEDERPARLEMARHAVRQAGHHPGAPELEALATLLRADLEVAEGRPGSALAVLSSGIGLFLTPDAPTVSFEVARVRARALTMLGTPEARRQAQHAYAIAVGEGWPHRAQQISAEFDLGTDWLGISNGGVSTSSSSSTYSAGHERQRLKALQTVSAAAARELKPRVLAQIALEETIKLLSADRAFLFLVPEDEEEASLAGGLRAYLGSDADGNDIPELTGYSTTLVDRVRQTGQAQVFTGTEQGAVLGTKSVVTHGLRSVLAAPMKVDGRMTGVVYLDSQVAKGIFTPGDVDILSALTNHIATSMETARIAELQISMETANRERAVAVSLQDALREMAERLDDPQQLLSELLRATGPVLGADRAWLLSQDEEAFLLWAAQDEQPLRIEEDAKLRGLMALRQPRVGSPELVPAGLTAQLGGVSSWIGVPMRSRRNDLGVLLVATTGHAALSENITTAAVLAAQGMSAYDNSTLFQQVQNLAVVDDLTGIPNRRHFFELAGRDLAAARRHGRGLSALMIDIDHFKRVNDTYGHPTGDDVIKAVAARFREQIRSVDVLGRYGGEEFAVLLQEAQTDGVLPERLRACIADKPVHTRSGPLEVTVSVGMTFLLEDDEAVETLLSRADQGLYKAKQNGRNQICFQEHDAGADHRKAG